MTRKRKRFWLLAASLTLAGIAATLIVTAFRDNIVFFFPPAELIEKNLAIGTRIRVGGLVEAGSVTREGARITFTVSDGAARVIVTYEGVTPDLFREGQGIVADGLWQGLQEDAGLMTATSVLAKHDEKYMPSEVADSLKKSGYWKEGTPP